MRIRDIFSEKKAVYLLLSVFFIMLAFNFMTPIVADDYSYSYSWSYDGRVDSVIEVYRSMVSHWLGWHSRVLANGFATYFLMYHKAYFNIANSLNTALIVLIMYYIYGIFTGDAKKAFMPSLLSVVLLWCFTPAFGQIFLWLDGACNYSWGVTFFLIFLVPYFAEYFGKGFRFHPLMAAVMVIEAFLAGSYYESGAVSSIFIALCILVLCFIRRRKVRVPLVLNLISAAAGFCFMMSAPSMKAGHRGEFSLATVLGLIEKLFGAVGAVFSRLGPALSAALMLLFTAAVLLLVFTRKKKSLFWGILYAYCFAGFLGLYALAVLGDLRQASGLLGCMQVLVTSPGGSILLMCLVFSVLFLAALRHKADIYIILLSLVLLAAGIGSVAAFIFASYLPARGALYLIVYLTLASGLLIHELRGEKKLVKRTGSLLVALFALSFVLGTADIVHIHRQNTERLATIEKAQLEALESIELEAFSSMTKYSAPYGLQDLEPDPTSWINGEISRYYGIGEVYMK